jgi:hypothetical protein
MLSVNSLGLGRDYWATGTNGCSGGITKTKASAVITRRCRQSFDPGPGIAFGNGDRLGVMDSLPQSIYSTQPKRKPQSLGCLYIVAALFVAYFVWKLLPVNLEREAGELMRNISQQRASELEQQYVLARKHGTPMDAYHAAMQCAMAYLDLKDEANYKKWKQIENAEARRARVPFR